MAKPEPIFARETFQFFRDLTRHNQKTWMDANRERYQRSVVRPFRRLLAATSPAVLALDSQFNTTARGGRNFSRINRDTRFAKDKTPDRAQMYLKYAVPFAGEGETGELYTGFSASTVTAGFRIYARSKYKISTLALVACARLVGEANWVVRQKKRLGKRYESYGYAMDKGTWAERRGWPVSPEDWKKLRAWIVRRKLTPAAATRAAFAGDLSKMFRELYPLLRFTCLRDAGR